MPKSLFTGNYFVEDRWPFCPSTTSGVHRESEVKFEDNISLGHFTGFLLFLRFLLTIKLPEIMEMEHFWTDIAFLYFL